MPEGRPATLIQWGAMPVQLPPSPATRRKPWTVLGDDGPVALIEHYLGHLTDLERPRTPCRRTPTI